MDKIMMKLDGRDVVARPGQTILDVCKENGIEIPTLCFDEQLRPSGECWMCAVEIKGYALVTSCATRVADGMEVITDSPLIHKLRRQVLDNFITEHYGDCVAPCQVACPAGIDIQGYLALIARGAYPEAISLIKERLPLPGTIGRICPRFCERECRRSIMDEPISICSLKRFAADQTLKVNKKPAKLEVPPTGKKIAIVGAGPAGLSAAYYLALKGHEVTILEALPDAGGMLRFGVPDYRLPWDVLGGEIKMIIDIGVDLKTNKRLGRDFTIKSLFNEGYEAVFLAIGAHISQKMKVEGEDIPGVYSGTDFLRDVVLKNPVNLGKRVAVIGGGNTAIDGTRVALRLGAEEVSLIYRRSRAEMPASEWEVKEAEEEGVKILFLTAPIRVVSEGGRATGIECVKMELGEPDKSGRPKPVPVKGSEFIIPVDSIISAIGQKPDVSCLADQSDIELKWDQIMVDTAMRTNIDGVFSGGDCVTGPATAVEAIAAGRKAAVSIDNFVMGKEVAEEKKQFAVNKGKLKEIDPAEFSHLKSAPRIKMPMLSPEERRSVWTEIELGFEEDAARNEAKRCIECGCKAQSVCMLRSLSTKYGIAPRTVRPNHVLYPFDRSHPFIERDPNKCISCDRCVEVCREVEGIGALRLIHRIGTPAGYGAPLGETSCVSCGLCVASCPVAGVAPRDNTWVEKEVKTTCPYCGVGCGLILGVRGGIVLGVRGDAKNPVNRGNTCVKGRFGYPFINSPERLTAPLIRRDGKFEKATWDEALDLIASKFNQYKGEQFAMLASARCTNEENYVMQKFTRAVMGTNNIDHCARLCHAASVSGLAQTVGSGSMTNSIREIARAKTIFVVGGNTTSTHPVIGLDLLKALKIGGKLIVANPKTIDLSRFADVCIQHHPGTDVALLMGMAKVIVDENLYDKEFIEKRCDDFEKFKDSLSNFDMDFVEATTGVPRDKIIKAARTYATHKPSTILYGMGITQHTHGTDNVLAISNLALLTGNIGKPSTGINPLRGQNNVQGSCDMGSLPNVYPGYQKVNDQAVRQKFETAWGVKLSDSVGLTVGEILEKAHHHDIKAMYIAGENVMLSDPDLTHVEDSLNALDFLVVQDIFLTETAQLADVVLPASSFAEKDGTFTNTERRVQRIRKAIEPVGESKPDWVIVDMIAKKMGASGFDFESASDIMDEIASLTPSFKGISYKRIENVGIHWPCPDEHHPGTPMLHIEKFATENGKGHFKPLQYRPSAELPDAEYPLIMTTERSLFHYHTGTMTRKVAGLNILHKEELVEMNPGDASKIGLADGDKIKIISRRGEVTAKVLLTEASPAGVISMSFHFAESPVNRITNPAVDPVCKTPEFKVCAVRVEKIVNA